MSKFSLSSLRSRAIVLVLLASFPLLALTFYSYLDQRDQDISEVQIHELVAARNLATLKESLISDSRKLLATLAQLPQVQRRDRNACSALFADLLKQSPQSASIVATDSEGRLFCGAPAAPGPVNYADRRWFQKIIQTRDFVIEEAVLGRSSGKYGTILAYPILDGDGRFQGALATQLDLQWLGNLLAKSDFPPTTALALTDSTKVLFRYPEPQKYIGKPLPDSLVKAMAISDEGVAAGVGLPGDERLFAFVRLSAPLQEMRLAIGLPRDWAVGRANHALWRNLIWLGLVALFAIVAAWFGGDIFILRPVKKLRAITERLAAGDLSVRAGPNYTAGELGLLSHSFDQMADSLHEREEDLRLSNEELQREIEERQSAEMALEKERQRLYALLDTLPGIIYLKGEDYIVHFANQGFRELFEDPQGKKCYEIVANLSEPCPGCPSLDVLRTGTPNQSEWTPPNIPRTFQVYNYPFADYDGSNLVLTLAVDITARKQAEQKLRDSEQNLRHLASQLLTAQERERNRISRELHDELGQALLVLKLQARDIQEQIDKNPKVAGEECREMSAKLDQLVENVRRLSRDLSPAVLEDLGLTSALRHLVNEFAKRDNLQANLDLPPLDGLFPKEAQINIYRIFQESLTNIGKYAQASSLTMDVNQKNGWISFRLADDGQGFDVEKVMARESTRRGLGLAAMEERGRMLGGKLKIKSQPGQGTEIILSVPIGKDDEVAS